MAVVAVGLHDDVAEIDADAEHGLVGIAGPDSVGAELALHVDREPHGLKGAVEGGLDGVAGDVEDAPFIVADQRPEEVHTPHDPAVCAHLIALHRAAVVDDIGEQDCDQALSNLVFRGRGHGAKLLCLISGTLSPR